MIHITVMPEPISVQDSLFSPAAPGGWLRSTVLQDFAGAEVVFGDVTDIENIKRTAFGRPVDVVVSCLASRTGGKVIRRTQ